jgi:hypothetical protein
LEKSRKAEELVSVKTGMLLIVGSLSYPFPLRFFTLPAVDIWVVYETLPANGCTWLLKVCAHHDQQLSLQLVSYFLESFTCIDSGGQ